MLLAFLLVALALGRRLALRTMCRRVAVPLAAYTTLNLARIALRAGCVWPANLLRAGHDYLLSITRLMSSLVVIFLLTILIIFQLKFII